MEGSYLSKETCANVQYKQTSRAVLVTDQSIMKVDFNQQISILIGPVEPGACFTWVTELCSLTITHMKDYCLALYTCESLKTATEDSESVVKKLFTPLA